MCVCVCVSVFIECLQLLTYLNILVSTMDTNYPQCFPTTFHPHGMTFSPLPQEQ